jgi:hypothetical protein
LTEDKSGNTVDISKGIGGEISEIVWWAAEGLHRKRTSREGRVFFLQARQAARTDVSMQTGEVIQVMRRPPRPGRQLGQDHQNQRQHMEIAGGTEIYDLTRENHQWQK